jgi:hypothetical protein
MNDPHAVGASDGDRDTAMERLDVAAAEGRLTSEELTARIDAVRDATTHGELVEVTADLAERDRALWGNEAHPVVALGG